MHVGRACALYQVVPAVRCHCEQASTRPPCAPPHPVALFSARTYGTARKCCECTCVPRLNDDGTDYKGCSWFTCVDPEAPCVDPAASMSYDFIPWEVDDDGEISQDDDDDDDDDFAPWVQEGPLPTVDGAVEVGAKTEVTVTATAYDTRPGRSSADIGCGEAGGDGCAPENSRDGVASEIESRWSCASKIMEEDEGPCQIEYTFAEPQDVVDIQVAFWKGDQRVRTLKVSWVY